MARQQNKDLAEHIEEVRQNDRSAEHTPDEEFFDLDDDGDLVEVKTTTRNVENPSGVRTGRYQIEESNHRKLVEAGGTYDFVLRDENDAVLDVETMSAVELDELIEENNRTWPSGSKLKIRHDVIHEETE